MIKKLVQGVPLASSGSECCILFSVYGSVGSICSFACKSADQGIRGCNIAIIHRFPSLCEKKEMNTYPPLL